MKLLKELNLTPEKDKLEVDDRAPYLGFLNLLLFCGTVFVIGFVSRHTENVPNIPAPVVEKEVANSEELPADLENLKEELQTEFAPVTGLSDFAVKVNGSSLEIHFGIGDIFKAGSSDLAGNKELPLTYLAQFIQKKVEPYKIEFEGHTDDVPVVKNAWKFPTNWELSTARASRILRVFAENGLVRSNMKVSGKSWYEPKAPNRTPAGDPIYKNQIKNRRLVLKIN